MSQMGHTGTVYFVHIPRAMKRASIAASPSNKEIPTDPTADRKQMFMRDLLTQRE
jgi:hypothetical protein